MKKILVKSQSGDYPVLIGKGILRKTGEWMKALGLRGKVMIVTQPAIDRLYGAKLRRSLAKSGYASQIHRVPPSELAKSQKELFRLYTTLLRKGFERGDVILALGGGVVGDLAGYAAATYLRGVPFVNVATTLLAQVDSSIGGKTAIDLPEGKNLAGAFYPPRLVVSDVSVLKTLPVREYRSSLAEVVKYGVIRDLSLFRLLETSSLKIFRRDAALLEKIVFISAAIKASVVGRDEYETKKERVILNFGHTFAHGFEQAAGYTKLMHGEAVAAGMVCAARLARKLGVFSDPEISRLEKLLWVLGLPISLGRLRLSPGKILAAMNRDKKKRGGQLRFVLPLKIGKVTLKGGVAQSLVRDTIMSAN